MRAFTLMLAAFACLASFIAPGAANAARRITLNPATMSCEQLAYAVAGAFDASVHGTKFYNFERTLPTGLVIDVLAFQLRHGTRDQQTNASSSLRFFEIFMDRGC